MTIIFPFLFCIFNIYDINLLFPFFFINKPEVFSLDTKNVVLQQLKRIGIEEEKALLILKRHNEDTINKWLQVIIDKKLYNPGAFLIKVLDENWVCPLK
jgi:hypothetical protein